MSMAVSLATNDEHGNSTGRVSAVHIEDAIELQWEEIGDGPRYSIEDDVLQISHHKTPIYTSQDWYGNMVWTGVSMSKAAAAALLNALSKEPRWHCEGGWVELTEAYEKGEVTAQHLEGI